MVSSASCTSSYRMIVVTVSRLISLALGSVGPSEDRVRVAELARCATGAKPIAARVAGREDHRGSWTRVAASVRYRHRFFFQAEDGIRDVAVTGVQTCALPISCRAGCRAP